MSREIKFRAWDKQNKNMEEVDLLGSNVLHIKNSEWENIEDFEVMQYTGLKDLKGKELYEGDIIKWGHIGDIKEDPIRIAIVEINPDLQFRCINLEYRNKNVIFNYGNFAYKDTEKYVEKIGDIYTTPEILKEVAK